MKADTLTLTNLFNRPVTYVVPLFQRPYVWNKGEHWQPLWEDFLAVAERLLDARANATEEELERGVPEQSTASHFLGAVVLEQVPTGAGMIERRNIIDGQRDCSPSSCSWMRLTMLPPSTGTTGRRYSPC